MNPFRSSCVVALVLTALLAPAWASGAPRVQTGTVGYQILMSPTPGTAVVVALMQLPESAKLPATVRIPVPKGMEVLWAGEVSGSGPSSDVERPYELKQDAQGAYAEFVVEQYRRAQIDTGGRTFDARSPVVSEQFDFVQSVRTGESAFLVRVPPGAYDVGIEPPAISEPTFGPTGEAFFSLAPKQLKPGETERVSVSYRVKRIRSQDVERSGASQAILIGIAIAALLVIIALVIAVKGAGRRG